MKRAFLFPGQGAQTVGMGKDFYDKYDEAKKIYDDATRISGIDVKRICFEGPEEELSKGISAKIATGLSLGEYSALIYSGYISFEDGIKLIQKRGYYMGNMIPKEEYSMCAVMGLETQKIEEVCAKVKASGNFVVPTNYNYSGQTVISGNVNAVELCIEKLKQEGAKKVIKLKTSGPFHTEKLNDAKTEFEKELKKVEFNVGKVNVIKNLDGSFYTKTDNLIQILSNHIVNPVRFDKAIKLMQQEGIEEYVEIGPGKALTGFIKKEDKVANTFNINSVEALEEYLQSKV